jgi:hypothetical protein
VELKRQATEQLGEFSGQPIDLSMLDEVSKRVNTLLDKWVNENNVVIYHAGIPVREITLTLVQNASGQSVKMNIKSYGDK